MTVLEPMLKHPGHPDQKVHAGKHGGSVAPAAREGRRIESSEAMDEAFRAEIDDRAMVSYSENDQRFAGAMKMSIAERIEERMGDVPTEDLVKTLSPEQQQDANYALGLGNSSSKNTDSVTVMDGHLMFTETRNAEGRTDLLGREYAELGTPMAEMMVRQQAISSMVQSWASSSNDSNPKSLAIQEAATKEFGLSKPAKWDMEDNVRVETSRLLAENEGTYRKFLRAQYDETQSMLSGQGISEIVAYRGM